MQARHHERGDGTSFALACGDCCGHHSAVRVFFATDHPASSDVAAEKRADGVVEEAQAVVTAIEDAVVRPTTVKSFTSPVIADVIVDPDVNRAGRLVLDDQEIQRRRDLVRTLFNDFWTGAYEKAGSVRRAA